MHQTFSAALEMNLLHANQTGADHNRAHFDQWGITCLNIMSSPGAGKTVLLERTLTALQPELAIAVIEGDMTTELDAERLRRSGSPVLAINTGRACHLDAQMVAGSLHVLATQYQPQSFDLVLVENVGNLVCPAEFEVGEHAKVALLSLTEGEDKPLKYPIMFREADCVLLTKLDLAPHLDLDLNQVIANVRQVNAQATILPLSGKTGVGMDAWYDWVRSQVQANSAGASPCYSPHPKSLSQSGRGTSNSPSPGLGEGVGG
ncbi:MAG: hydrogenase nickel incorporation protein HypB [Spirulinaceae cyanobacterium SM2_1_0]|nr:hydrogenase nickel incorporation protein HypB [Spirulinaceae cyanobacterium SM2_1_0]